MLRCFLPAVLLLLLTGARPVPALEEIPDLQELIRETGDRLLNAQRDNSLDEEEREALRERLGALYILAGHSAAGRRFIHPSQVGPPLPNEVSGQAPGAQFLSPDLPTLGRRLLDRSADPLDRAAGVFLLIASGRAEEAAKTVGEASSGASALFQWLRVLFLMETGQTQSAAREARALADRLEGRSPFLLRNIACIVPDSSPSFGVYKPLENATYSTGDLLAVYYELEGFETEKRGENYQVKFQVDLGIFDDSGREVWHKATPDVAGHSTRSEVRDLFLTSAFYVPSVLEPGRYALRVEVTDLVGKARAVGEVPFRVRPAR